MRNWELDDVLLIKFVKAAVMIWILLHEQGDKWAGESPTMKFSGPKRQF